MAGDQGKPGELGHRNIEVRGHHAPLAWRAHRPLVATISAPSTSECSGISERSKKLLLYSLTYSSGISHLVTTLVAISLLVILVAKALVLLVLLIWVTSMCGSCSDEQCVHAILQLLSVARGAKGPRC